MDKVYFDDFIFPVLERYGLDPRDLVLIEHLSVDEIEEKADAYYRSLEP